MLRHMHAHRRHTHTTFKCTHTHSSHTHMHTYTCLHTSMHTETETHTYTETYMHTHMHTHRHKTWVCRKKNQGITNQPYVTHNSTYPHFTGHHEPPRNQLRHQFLSLNPRFWSWRSQVGHASGISKVLLADVTHPGLRATPWALAQPTLPVSGGLGRSCPHLSRPGLPEAPEGAPRTQDISQSSSAGPRPTPDPTQPPRSKV